MTLDVRTLPPALHLQIGSSMASDITLSVITSHPGQAGCSSVPWHRSLHSPHGDAHHHRSL